MLMLASFFFMQWHKEVIFPKSGMRHSFAGGLAGRKAGGQQFIMLSQSQTDD